MSKMTLRQMEALEQMSGVSRHTLFKIKRGITPNPGIDTVHKFIGHVRAALRTAP